MEPPGRRLGLLSGRAAVSGRRVSVHLACRALQDDVLAYPSLDRSAVLDRALVLCRDMVFGAEPAVPVTPEFRVTPLAALRALRVGALLDEWGRNALLACDAHTGHQLLRLVEVPHRENYRRRHRLVVPDLRPWLEPPYPGGDLDAFVFRLNLFPQEVEPVALAVWSRAAVLVRAMRTF